MVADWGEWNGLRFSPAKSVPIMFTKRRNFKVKPLRMNGKELQWQTAVKYLGVTLDAKLSWRMHVAQKTKKAKALMFMYKGIVGRYFGPQLR